jgi:hypothetical protein
MITDDKPLSPNEQEANALKAIARTEDGALLHRYLRRVLEGVFDFETDGALRAHNGRRTLARDLMRLMAEGIDDRRTDQSGDPILARASSGGTPVAARRGAGRRITADTRTAYDADRER